MSINSSSTGILRQYNQILVGLMAQLVEHYTGIAEVMGSNPVQAWIFFSISFRNSLSWVSNFEGLSRSSIF